jgi:hypothetical protein
MPSYMMATSCSGAKARQSQIVEAHSSSIGKIIEVADTDMCAKDEGELLPPPTMAGMVRPICHRQ